jgi:hypothetical protein
MPSKIYQLNFLFSGVFHKNVIFNELLMTIRVLFTFLLSQSSWLQREHPRSPHSAVQGVVLQPEALSLVLALKQRGLGLKISPLIYDTKYELHFCDADQVYSKPLF